MISEEVIPMKHIYNKLVRDRIPEIVENDHKTCVTRTLNDEEYLKCLKSKLLEECHEVIEFIQRYSIPAKSEENNKTYKDQIKQIRQEQGM